MRATLDLLLWALVQMPLAFIDAGTYWLHRRVASGYWKVATFRRKLMKKQLSQPHDVLVGKCSE